MFANLGDLAAFPYYMGCTCPTSFVKNGSKCLNCSSFSSKDDSVNCQSCSVNYVRTAKGCVDCRNVPMSNGQSVNGGCICQTGFAFDNI